MHSTKSSRFDRVQGVYRPARRRRRVYIDLSPDLLILGVVVLVIFGAWMVVQIRMAGAS